MTLDDGTYEIAAGKLVECITHLEMTARPEARSEPEADFELRRWERPDPDRYLDLFRRIGEDWLWTSRLVCGRDELVAIITDPAVRIYSLRADDADEGLLELDFRVSGECELAFFGLTRRLVGQGAGRWLMNRALELAWSEPIRRFWVHTCSLDHPGALPFYTRSGFRAFRREIEIADDPRTTGVLPRHAAGHIPVI